jgi:hypothetical protein
MSGWSSRSSSDIVNLTTFHFFRVVQRVLTGIEIILLAFRGHGWMGVRLGFSRSDRLVRFGQVSVAILLDNFVSSSAQIQADEDRQLAAEHRRMEEGLNPFSRLLDCVSQVATPLLRAGL